MSDAGAAPTSGSGGGNGGGGSGGADSGSNGFRDRVIGLLRTQPLSFGLFCGRTGLVVVSLLCFVMQSYALLNLVLKLTMATSLVRLYQRIRQPDSRLHPAFSRAFAAQLKRTHAAHYFFYGFFFLRRYDLLSALPPAMHAVMSTSSYVVKHLLPQQQQQQQQQASSLLRRLYDTRVSNSLAPIIFEFAAVVEVILVTKACVGVLTGHGSFMTAIGGMQYLIWRLNGPDPYVRQMWLKNSLGMDMLTTHARCPSFVRTIYLKFKALLRRIAEYGA